MDQVVDYRERELKAKACLQQIQGEGPIPNLAEVEGHFLEVIQNDLHEAQAWLPCLRRLLKQCDVYGQGVLQRLLGRYYENLSHHRQAIKWTQRALSCFEAIKYQPGIGQCARLLFTAHAHLGEYLPATAQAKAMLSLAELPSEERLKITINLGALAYRQHDYPAAQKYFAQAHEQLRNHPNPLLHAIVTYNLGNLQVVFNQFGSAEKSFEGAKIAFHDLGQQLYLAHTAQAFGQLYAILGQYNKAEAHLVEAKTTYQRLSDPFGAMLCDLEIIRMNLGLNHHAKILNAMPELLFEFQKYGRSVELGQLCFYGALAANQGNEMELAEMYLDDAESIFRKIGDAFFIARCQTFRAPLLAQNHQTQEAIHLLTEAQAFFKKQSQPEHELNCLLHLWQLDSERFGEREYKSLRSLLRKPLAPQSMVQGNILLGNYWYRRRQFKRSLRALYAAVNILEESRASIPASSMRRSFFEDKAEIYERLLIRLLEWGQNDHLTFRVLQLSRGRQMADQLSKGDALPPVIHKRDPSILALQKLDLQINRLNSRLEGINREAKPTPQLQTKLLEDIRKKRSERLQLRRQLHQEDRLGIFFPLEIEPEAIMALLEPHQMVILFIRDKCQLYRMELTKNALKTVAVVLSSDFDKKLNRMIQILRFPIMAKMDLIPGLADDLSAFLLPQPRKDIFHYQFILHKSLHSFPLTLLRQENRYLIESHYISQCPNIAALYYTLKRGRPALTQPLFFLSQNQEDPEATERIILSQKFGQAKVFANFKTQDIPKRVAESDFIHFAGHCHFNGSRPTRSYLQLNSARVYLSQIGRWRMTQAPFINLAACQSGQTALDTGNEPFGFVVSAIGAGAAAVLASLWEIDDCATGRWMTAFYQSIDLGLAFAFRNACLSIMETMPQPYFWGGFALIGRADANIPPHKIGKETLFSAPQ